MCGVAYVRVKILKQSGFALYHSYRVDLYPLTYNLDKLLILMIKLVS